jgi:hypothetical protein
MDALMDASMDALMDASIGASIGASMDASMDAPFPLVCRSKPTGMPSYALTYPSASC